MESQKTLPKFTVSDFLASVNQTLEYAYTAVEIEGEVASFKVNQNKFVFFDLKDASGSVGCFMTVWQLRIAIQDGMKVIVKAQPKVTPWGKFSLTVQTVRPSGEGSLKKSFELLKAALEKEGLFAPERKRLLPELPARIAVISSTAAAGYADFIKILNDRWGGLAVEVAHVQVQGETAPDQIIRAINYFNEQPMLADVLVIVRGGGSADDLSAFNDELLVREIASSRIPVLTGIGHEVDVSLADLAADVRAVTPSNAAQLLVPDRREIIAANRHSLRTIMRIVEHAIEQTQSQTVQKLQGMFALLEANLAQTSRLLAQKKQILAAYDPRAVLNRGYAIVRGQEKPGGHITIEKKTVIIAAEVITCQQKQPKR